MGGVALGLSLGPTCHQTLAVPGEVVRHSSDRQQNCEKKTTEDKHVQHFLSTET